VPDGERLILGIENSNPDRGPGGFHGEVALARLGLGDRPEVLGRERIRPATQRDDDVMPAIDRLFRGAGRRPAELGRIAVSIGPGGFTGLRIATVTAKSLAEATGAGCIAVPTADALILRSKGQSARRRVAICLGWKQGTVWRARFEPGAASGDAELVPFDRVFEPVGSERGWGLVADQRLVALLESSGALPAGTVVEAPRYDATAVIEASVAMSETDPVVMAPLYPREPEAVTKWRALHPR